MSEKNKWGRNLSWKRGPVSPVKFPSIHPLGLDAVVPKAKNLRQQQSPVKDQGHAGACVAFATAAFAEFLQKKAMRLKIDSPLIYSDTKFVPLSELHLYYHNREREGTINQDSGSFIYNGITTAQLNGFCRSTIWPYDLNNLYSAPSKAAEEDGLKHRVGVGVHVDGIAQIEKCIASGYPVIIGTDVCASFMEVGPDGIYQGVEPGESPEGGHCLLLCGYSRMTKRMLLKNSWNRTWGRDGYVSVPYSWVEGFEDCHSIRVFSKLD